MSKDTSTPVTIKTFLFAGDKSFPPSLSQKLGACGLNPKKTSEDINKVLENWKGCRVFVEIVAVNRVADIKVRAGTSAHLIKEMGEMKPRDRKKEKLPNRTGNISFDKILKVARLVQEEGRSMSEDFKGTVKQVLGTCLTIGCTVDGKSAKEATKLVESGELKI